MNITGPIRQLIIEDVDASLILEERVFPVVLPQSTTYPAARLTIVGNSANNTKSGPSTEDLILLQISSFAYTYDEVAECDDAIRAAIDYFRGMVTVGSIVHGLDLVEYETSQDFYEDEARIFHRASDYRVRYSRDPASMIPQGLIGGEFDSDESALLAGLVYGQHYYASDTHTSVKKGVLIKLLT